VAPRRRPAGLLLTPGAGSDASHHTLVAIEEAVAPMPVRRVDFPYRKEGRRAPDRAPKLIESVRADAVDFARSRRARPHRILLGGRSMGGRMCSMAVAEGLPAAGLVLISYPLHPPGKPDRLRVEHLPQLEVPCLFVTGTRDPFGTPEELQEATATIPGAVTHVWIEGGRHDLKGADPQIAAAVAGWIDALPPVAPLS
jgi:predicted alpha/beta-hydrolase family hydrolase